MPEPERIDRRRVALIAYDVCRRALTPSDPARKAAMRPVLDAWAQMIATGRAAGVPVIYTTPVSRSDGADVVMLPTDLSAETGVPPLTNAVEGTAEAGFPDEIAPRPEDYVFLKRRPSAFYGTGVAELLQMLRRDTIIIGGGATNRGVETSVREAFNLDLASVVVRECCWSGDPAAHAYSLDKAMKCTRASEPSSRSRRCCGNDGHHTMSRPRAADDFKMIRTRMEELRRERLPEQPAPTTDTPTTDTGVAFHRGPCACGRSLFPDECDGSCKAL